MMDIKSFPETIYANTKTAFLQTITDASTLYRNPTHVCVSMFREMKMKL